MICCTNTYNLGCFNHCSEITFQNSTVTGVLSLIYFGANHVIKKNFNATIGQPIILNLEGLNENYKYDLQIFDQNNEIITFTINAENYDCFQIKTKIYNEI